MKELDEPRAEIGSHQQADHGVQVHQAELVEPLLHRREIRREHVHDEGDVGRLVGWIRQLVECHGGVGLGEEGDWVVE